MQELFKMFCRYKTLSPATRAEWLPGGTLLLSRKRFADLGNNKQWIYKVYVKAQTCFAILSKHLDVQLGMQDILNKSIPSPHFIELHNKNVIRLSVLTNKKKDQVGYYGIHILDEEDEILPGMGLNLKEEEFANLINMMDEHRKAVEDYKKEMGFEENTPIEQIHAFFVTRAGKKRKHTGSNPGQDKKMLLATLYGWNWHVQGLEETPLTKESKGNWFINGRACYQEAMTYKPIGEGYVLEIVEKPTPLEIGKEMVEAAIARLITYNIPSCRDNPKFSYLRESGCDDLEAFGGECLKMVTDEKIYDLCKKAITHYQDLPPISDVHINRKM